jgi:hypothetical protein
MEKIDDLFILFLLVLYANFVQNFTLITNLLSEIRCSVIFWLRSFLEMTNFNFLALKAIFSKSMNLYAYSHRETLWKIKQGFKKYINY